MTVTLEPYGIQANLAQFDWEKATAAFGSASVQSMKVSLKNLLKKIGSAQEGADPSPAKMPRGERSARPPRRETKTTLSRRRRSVEVAGRRRPRARRPWKVSRTPTTTSVAEKTH